MDVAIFRDSGLRPASLKPAPQSPLVPGIGEAPLETTALAAGSAAVGGVGKETGPPAPIVTALAGPLGGSTAASANALATAAATVLQVRACNELRFMSCRVLSAPGLAPRRCGQPPAAVVGHHLSDSSRGLSSPIESK